ncbi:MULTISPECIES: 2-oxo-4-hydroxy-4-carboxy-5-ureidoimidazoline decarboxylase [Corallococcus]|uniref:2-oxo-4-hydroxy-4-carboxy-5-ureidoimidazoline decarboxylase n=1 Tax=Corallococcus TaxID=83461 RepID=UPI001180628B|nr:MULTISPECIES: 2-oxo-4-hydroxy-4-carboxy-5-ureidoimidazoline decarboxylase [Corallococcus]NBD09314.1 2-oxo-4-hydroxy-4-carboxy-5-ureidoimidazoline decarboxylase [Corallococcus silvisoli]TSC31279.1 2-oxo-4-hydroxy-4-carboxy-5-ureidoimidazoline decarboxylase [Corallococcus sp. Z5C101001]
MSTPLERLNTATTEEATQALTRCCGSTRWVRRMLAVRPFRDAEHLYAEAADAWALTGPEDWKEAFTHHPRIGDVAKLREKFASTAQWSSQEQQGVAAAGERVLEALAQGNRDYEARYGFIFLVCATGKSAAQMLELLQGRMDHAPDVELRIAAGEQAKITRIRLEKLLAS